ncbi:MAG TPA: Crp/Fnr family transcriptional regulator [Acidimicrobiia bacterium]
MSAARFLDNLDPQAREAFAALGTQRRFDAGSTMFVEGDRSGHVIVILTGRVKVYATSLDGQDFLLAVRGPGEVLGDFSAIDDAPRSASGVALEAVEARMIPARTFRDFLSDTPGAGLALLTTLVDRMRDSDRQRVDLGARDTLGRVSMRLFELVESCGVQEDGAMRIDMPLTQDDLAGWVAASREAVARALASLRKRGIITTARREIRVLDIDSLREAAR